VLGDIGVGGRATARRGSVSGRRGSVSGGGGGAGAGGVVAPRFPLGGRLAVSLAVIPGALHGAFSPARLPCRVRAGGAAVRRAGELAAAMGALLSARRRAESSAAARLGVTDGGDDDGASSAGGGATARSGADAGGGGGEEAGGARAVRGAVFAGYIYVLDDGTVLSLDAPGTASDAARALPNAHAPLFDARFVTLADDI
jgi:hypothetical protein